MTTRRWPLAVVLLQVSPLLSGARANESPKLDLSLLAAPADLPDYLCILSTQKIDKARALADTPFENLRTRGILSPVGAAEERRYRFAARDLPASELPRSLTDPKVLAKKSHAKQQEEMSALISSGSWYKPSLRRAIQSLSTFCEDGVECPCDGHHQGCAPGVVLRDELYRDGTLRGEIACTQSASPNGHGLVALVFLDFRRQLEAAVMDIRLAGNTATITLAKPFHDSDLPYAFVLGGHYVPEPNAGVPGSQGRISLPLSPTCVAVTAKLPPHGPITIESAIAQTGTRVDCRPSTHEEELVNVRVPSTTHRRPKSLRIAAIDHGSKRPVTFEARWTESSPRSTLSLGYRSAPLRWSRSCLYPPSFIPESRRKVKRKGDDVLRSPDRNFTEACPRVTLPSLGVTCRPAGDEVDGVCTYGCTTRDASDTFELPTQVRFERVTYQCLSASEEGDAPCLDGRVAWTEVVTDAWEDTWVTAGQLFSSFVPADARHVELRLGGEHWNSIDGDDLERIDVHGPGGTAHHILLTEEHGSRVAVPVPGVACGDAVSIQIDGAREYERRTIAVKSGVVELRAPPSYLREPRLGWFVGTGFDAPHFERLDQILGSGLVEPSVAAGLYVWAPTAYRLHAVELEAEAEATRKAYGVVGRDDVDTDPDLDHVFYYRFGGRLRWVYASARDIHLGIDTGLGFGSPMLRRHEARVGPPTLYAALGGSLRVRLTGRKATWLELAAGFRVLENEYRFETDFTGDPEPIPSSSLRAVVQLRIRFGP